MTEDLVKRVAKAIADNIQAALPSVYVHSIDYESAAHAAIEAMRELPSDPGPRYDAGEYSRRSQVAMIEDALKEKP